MAEMTPEELSDRLQAHVDNGREREAFIRKLAFDIPDHPREFERVKQTTVGQVSVPVGELADLELGPNNCAAE
jgi:hypothetical protein